MNTEGYEVQKGGTLHTLLLQHGSHYGGKIIEIY